MKISAESRSLKSDKLSRTLELVRNRRSAVEKPNRRLRIGLSDNLFVDQAHRSKKFREPSTRPSGASTEAPGLRLEVSRVQLAVGLAAIAGATLGYLFGRRKK